MRIFERIHPNRQIRTFTCEEVVSANGIVASYSTRDATPDAIRLYERLGAIKLVEDVMLEKYGVRITIVDGFQFGEDDWSRVRQDMLKVLSDHFGLLASDIEHAVL